MSDTKFKVGDRVRYNGSDEGGSWIEVQVDNSFEGTLFEKFGKDEWLVKWDLNPIEFEYEDCLELVSRPSDDPKTAFLTELKALLEKYGVEIDINSTNGDEEEGIIFLFGKEYISYTSRPFNPNKLKEFIFPITPSNIFDYDKGE